jgi:hypothetical protein
VLPCSWFIAFKNEWPTLAPTSGEPQRPPSASIHLRHAAEEDNSARGCFAATGHKSGHSPYEKLGARRERLLAQCFMRRRSLTRRLGTWKQFISTYRGRRKKCFGWPTFRGRLTKQLRRCVISLKMTKNEGPNTGSFVKKPNQRRWMVRRLSPW